MKRLMVYWNIIRDNYQPLKFSITQRFGFWSILFKPLTKYQTVVSCTNSKVEVFPLAW